LMDVQMPVLDGHDATRQLRNDGRYWEMPIIAMTAGASSRDEGQALDAGMNDYIAKPIDPEGLIFKLTKWIAVEKQSGAAASWIPTQLLDPALLPAVPGIDVTSGLARVGGRWSVYRALLADFLEVHDAALGQVGRLLADQGRSPELDRHIHTVKGVAGNIGADSLHRAAARLEAALRSGAAGDDDVQSVVLRFEQALAEARDGISAVLDFVQEPTPVPAESEAPPVGSRELENLLRRLATLLDDGNIEAWDLLSGVRNQLRSAGLDDAVDRLDRKVAEYDFDSALVALDAVAAKLNITLQNKQG